MRIIEIEFFIILLKWVYCCFNILFVFLKNVELDFLECIAPRHVHSQATEENVKCFATVQKMNATLYLDVRRQLVTQENIDIKHASI